MRCKPGILAYCASPHADPHNGKVVTVVRLLPHNPSWTQQDGPPPFWRVEADWLLTQYPGEVNFRASDAWLRPITGLPDADVVEDDIKTPVAA